MSTQVEPVARAIGPPNTTTGTSESYIQQMATVVSHAILPSPIWRVFIREGPYNLPNTASNDDRQQEYHALIEQYLLPGVAAGAQIIEAGDFSACAAWWPPGSHRPPQAPTNDQSEDGTEEMLMSAFERQIDQVRNEHVWSKYGQEYWYLGLLGRDPRKLAVPGAVRAVLRPYIERAAREGKPIWLTTTNPRARDIYVHLGWAVVKEVVVREWRQWCMIRYPPSAGGQSEKELSGPRTTSISTQKDDSNEDQ